MPGAPFGIFEKSFSPSSLLFLHAERAVVGRDALQVVERQAAPQLILLRPVAQRRAHHVLRAAEVRLLVVVVRQEQVLRTGFGERRQAAVARFGDHLERLGRRQVDDVDRHVGDFGQRDGAVGRFRFGARRTRQRVVLRRGLALRRARAAPARR